MFSRFLHHVTEFLKNEDGPTAVEYAINLALVIAFLVSTISGLSNKATKSFSTVSNTLSNSTGS